MTAIEWIITSYSLFFCACWILLYSYAIRVILGITKFEDQRYPSLETYPKLSIIIAACNEEATIESALTTLLKQNYQNLELIVVNDRSTDKTGDIIDSYAAKDKRINPVHLNHLPPGWLGKINALNQGYKEATGEWLLFTDADVLFKENILKQCIDYVKHDNCDHLVFIPDIVSHSILMEGIMRAFAIAFLLQTKAHLVNKEKSFIGVGAFNMVRKAALENSPGFEWFKMEIADDVTLGMMLKNAGYRTRFFFALNDVEVTWHPSIKSMFKGIEKIGHYPLIKFGFRAMLTFAFIPAPFIAICFFKTLPLTAFVGILALCSLVIYSACWSKHFKQKFAYGLLIPIGQLFLALMLLNGLIKGALKGKITWRTTDYTCQELRNNQRLFM